MMQKCCGYYCAMIAMVGIFFYAVVLLMEIRRNQFVLYRLQYPEDPKEAVEKFEGKTSQDVAVAMNEEADHKITAMAIAIGLNVLCIAGCLLSAKLAEKKERDARARQEAEMEEFKEN
jgi:hypothetical protein